MCQRSPGPRCASHARKAVQSAAKEIEKLEASGAAQKEIKQAKLAFAGAVKIYDSTPTGQKKLAEKIEALKAEQKTAPTPEAAKEAKKEAHSLTIRLNAGKKLRAQQEHDLAQVVAEERAAAARAERLIEMREEEANKPDNAFKTAVSSYVLREGVFLKSQYWGGPTTDYEAKEHLARCGVLHTGETSESYSWENYDTFSTKDHIGFSMDTTCNCGEIFERPIVVENATMSSVMLGILNE